MATNLNQYLGGTERLLLKLVLSFVRAFVGAFVVLVPGILAAPDLSTAKALAVAAVVGAFTAAVRALQAALGQLGS